MVTYGWLGKILQSQTELAKDAVQSTAGYFAPVATYKSTATIFRVYPDFVALGLLEESHSQTP